MKLLTFEERKARLLAEHGQFCQTNRGYAARRDRFIGIIAAKENIIECLRQRVEYQEANYKAHKRLESQLSSELCDERAEHQKTKDNSAERMSEIHRLSRQSNDRQSRINELDLEVLQLKEDAQKVCFKDSGCNRVDCRIERLGIAHLDRTEVAAERLKVIKELTEEKNVLLAEFDAVCEKLEAIQSVLDREE